MQNILVLSDLDGTLLTGKQQISPENAAAIRRFKSMGGRFTLATGRIEQSVAPFVRQLDIDMPVILYNGAKIVSPATGAVLYEKHMIINQELWDYFLGANFEEVAVLVYKNGTVYAPQRNAILEQYERKDGLTCLPLIPESLAEPVTKLMFIGSNPALLKSFEHKVAELGLACEIVYSESNYLEILPHGVSKGTALLELIRLLKIDGLYTIAIGDNLNDLSMITVADRGYAVENAHSELKDVANAITVHHEQHAIASIIGEIIMEVQSDLA